MMIPGGDKSHDLSGQDSEIASGEFRSDPLNVHLYITPLCNLKCFHCYYDARTLGDATGEMLSTSDIAFIVGSLTNHYEADIHMEGGEPFLRTDLASIMDLVPDPCWSAVTITTGGVAPITIGGDRLRKFGDVRVSLEGHTDAMQRQIRGIDLGRVLATCHQLEADGVAVTIRITLHRMNIACVPDMLSFFLDCGHSRFSLFELQPVGRGRRLDDLFLRESDLASALDDLARLPPDPRLRSLKLSLPLGRVPLVERSAERLRQVGYDIRAMGGVPSLTINSDGEMGCSAWNITSDGPADRIGMFRREDFAEQVWLLVRGGSLSLPCRFSSEISIRYSRKP
jgi:MoaA/NifB/PqqE/SkfB family radical SAM enzyme